MCHLDSQRGERPSAPIRHPTAARNARRRNSSTNDADGCWKRVNVSFSMMVVGLWSYPTGRAG